MPCRFVRTWESFAINNEMWNVILNAQRTCFLLAFYCFITDSSMLGGAAGSQSLHRWATYALLWSRCLRANLRNSVNPIVFLFVRANDWGPLPSCIQFHALLILCKSVRWLFIAFVSQKAALDLMQLLSRDVAVRKSHIMGPVLVRSRASASGGRDLHEGWGLSAKKWINEQHTTVLAAELFVSCSAKLLFSR